MFPVLRLFARQQLVTPRPARPTRSAKAAQVLTLARRVGTQVWRLSARINTLEQQMQTGMDPPTQKLDPGFEFLQSLLS